MNIYGYNKLSLLDFPGKLASTVFTGYCNFKCPFCHNASLVLHPETVTTISPEAVFDHLKSRAATLEGICITGGEPTLNRDLPDFLEKLRTYNLGVKLDTNGYNPRMLKELIDQKLIDHIAMDIKASPANYQRATGIEPFDMDKIFRSVDLIMSSGLTYEFRTTVVEGIHTKDDFISIGKWLAGANAYYLQCFKDSRDLIAPQGLSSPTKETLNNYLNILLPSIPNTFLRGID